MNIKPSNKLRRGSEHFLNGKSVYIERDRQDGTVLISDSKLLRPEDNYWTILKSDLKPSFKTGSSITKKLKVLSEAEIKEKQDMNAFFDILADKIPFNCTNCRKPLYAFSKIAKRSVCSHILPKAIFKTIATDPDNIFFLGADFVNCPCDCHDRWGKNIDSRMHKDMTRVYDLSIKRYHEKLKAKIPKNQINAAEEYLGIITKSMNLVNDLKQAI